ncbi:type 1 glutamine amidotransferase [Acerihabitans sp. TG2]|uniref:type 1 glutamine amidotransferase n=1 Tax=Acerihabitans sp. TG2 TaxID=3096008 RepID=UPI002B231DDD|nr:type 1 glutamine amidotransferase [Acerihabitans sp. TG2]MEA9392637.1 type 1 glutamine amidotransferase [Acerihabitans sp. TG2]
MRVAIVENMENTRLGVVLQALKEVNADIEWFRPYLDGRLPAGVDQHDALIVPGGWQSALDDDDYPFLPSLASLLREFGDASKSVLGICLGAQLLARAYGAENSVGTAREFAWTALNITQEGQHDPLFSGLGAQFHSFEWHMDTFSLPRHAVRLVSSSAVTNQCFRVGRAAYGMQFHIEADAATVTAWSAECRHNLELIAPNWLEHHAQADAAQFSAAAECAGLSIARAFVQTITP